MEREKLQTLYASYLSPYRKQERKVAGGLDAFVDEQPRKMLVDSSHTLVNSGYYRADTYTSSAKKMNREVD